MTKLGTTANLIPNLKVAHINWRLVGVVELYVTLYLEDGKLFRDCHLSANV